ncbi:hypothetical protein GCM10009826_12600 [Humibacillus xanthopallidus]
MMHRRSLSATATDRRWEWYESGTPFEFEDTERYIARRKRYRFDRELLLNYLEHLGIPARIDIRYGAAILLQKRAQYERRSMTLEDARAALASAAHPSHARQMRTVASWPRARYLACSETVTDVVPLEVLAPAVVAVTALLI